MHFVTFLVDGGYGKWSEWTSCLGDCGNGYKSRSRQCNNPTPAFGGRPCAEAGLGEAYERTSCRKNPCPGRFKERLSITVRKNTLELRRNTLE